MTGLVEAETGLRIDPTERIDLLLRDLRGSRSGLTTREAERRLIHYGPNVLRRRGSRSPLRELARQFSHPLALLLWAAAGLAAAVGIVPVAIAIVVVIMINAGFAFAQERHAEQAVEALAAYLPIRAKVMRDGQIAEVEATCVVPGDVLVITEGDRICADGRLLDGGIEVDLSELTGESMPVYRSADAVDAGTMTFFGMVAGQIGTAFAARTDRASLRSIGVLSNRLLLWGIGFELALAAVIIYLPVLQSLLGTAALTPAMLAFTLPYPFIVWGADELRRWLLRRHPQ
ncbi:HAD-IC family P-type ATPase [Nocardia beijingensis]